MTVSCHHCCWGDHSVLEVSSVKRKSNSEFYERVDDAGMYASYFRRGGVSQDNFFSHCSEMPMWVTPHTGTLYGIRIDFKKERRRALHT